MLFISPILVSNDQDSMHSVEIEILDELAFQSEDGSPVDPRILILDKPIERQLLVDVDLH